MIRFILAAVLVFSANLAFAIVEPGKPAPSFDVTDVNGKPQKLSEYTKEGKWVVLEWFNIHCPFVKKHYGSGNMQKLQEAYTAKGVVWLTVNSTAKSHKNYLDVPKTLAAAKELNAKPSAIIIDSDGKLGKSYGAQTTPHMFVIDPKGVVVYAGAIDDNKSSDPKVIKDSKNYVAAALDLGMKNQKIYPSATQPYGCGVKYN